MITSSHIHLEDGQEELVKRCLLEMGQVLVLTVLLNAIVIKVQALGTAHPAQPYADKIVKKSARPSASMVPAWLVWISAAKCDASQMYC